MVEDNIFKKVDLDNINQKKVKVDSVKDLAEYLRENQSINQPVIVHYKGDDSEVQKEALRLMKGESDHVIQIDNSTLAQKLGMEPGKFYCYYKPGYTNGFASYQG